MSESRKKAERVDITVRGRVQGVAYRFYTQTRARTLGVTGWVRNNPDGSVRLVAEGKRSALEALVDWTARGPSQARVDGQQVCWSEAAGAWNDFNITG